ncbi:hypothetical protein HDU78_002669 [Chytriomyces hyalinus]|nr:hypothetical protein HDU78_002669 [Chytriomyces hyalinus]
MSGFIPGLSLWLSPQHGSSMDSVLRAIITRYSSELGTPTWGPHITLLGSILATPEETVARLTEAVKDIEAFDVGLLDIVTKDQYFQCIMAKAEETPALMSLNAMLRSVFPAPNSAFANEKFWPHLSLVYGDLSSDVRERVAREIQQQKDASSVPWTLAVREIELGARGFCSAWKVRRAVAVDVGLKLLRVLCLHGSRQNSEVFRERLSRLETHLGYDQCEMVYVDGPLVMERMDGDAVAMRTWFGNVEGVSSGVVCACAMLRLLDRVWAMHGPFDGIVGFSAGAMAAVLVAGLPLRFEGLAWLLAAGCPGMHIPGNEGPNDIESTVDGLNEAGTDSARAFVTVCECSQLKEWRVPEHLRSLHVFGAADTLVPMTASTATAHLFTTPTLAMHDQGHSVPMRKPDLEKYSRFICTANASTTSLQLTDELDALAAIYPDEIVIESHPPIHNVTISIPLQETRFRGPLDIIFRLGPAYPQTLPSFTTSHQMGMLEFSSAAEAALTAAIKAAIEPLRGTSVLFDAISCATQFMQEYEEPADAGHLINQSSAPDSDSDFDLLDGADESLVILSHTGQSSNSLKSKNARGKWKHTIGLVGKPSAGKSTFFNAATRSSIARVAAHPFTTIDPNIAQGVWKVPSKYVPKRWIDEGRDVLIPCVIKDVAGLVPGAWEGRGRGNKFLNDLCDADVLIHVIDASGLSDENGNILPADTPNPQDPLHDIHWVRQELFHWIFSNIARKWDSIVKRPQRLPLMFSGYRAPQWLVAQVLADAQFDVTVSPPYAKQFWSLKKLETVVERFLDARFPMLLAMNKADLGPAAAHVERVKEKFGEAVVVPVCAAAEVWLQSQVKEGNVVFDDADGSHVLTQVAGRLESDKEQQEFQNVERVFDRYHGTGVEIALTAAVMMRSPVFCYPVDDLDHVSSVGGVSNLCVPMKPGSTVADVFELLSHGPEAVLAGQFVRAEAVGLDGLGKRPVKKEMEVDDSCSILKLMSNRKSRWQKG